MSHSPRVARAVAVGHPLDTVKVRMQSQTNQGGLVRVLMQGFRAGNLYAGAASPLLGSMAHNATLFFTIGQTQNLLRKLDPDEYWPVRDAFIGGAAVGVAATAVETPVDLLKCKVGHACSACAFAFYALTKMSRASAASVDRAQGRGGCGARHLRAPRHSGPMAGRRRHVSAQRAVLLHVLWLQRGWQRGVVTTFEHLH